MAKSYADDLRRKLLQAYDRGEGTLEQLAERFSVSVPWAWKISAQRKRSGQMERIEQRRGTSRKVTLAVQERLRGWVPSQPDTTLIELQQKLEKAQRLHVSLGRLWQVLRQMGSAAKKKSLHASERDTEANQRRRQSFQETIARIAPERLIFLDESGVTTQMTRGYARAYGGQRVAEATPQGHWKILTILSALSLRGLLATMTIEEPTDGDIFLAYVEQVLCPVLRPGDVVIMDNLSAHKVAGVRERIQAAGAEWLYLPPYSPDLNPIEKAWAKLKQLLRALKARTAEALELALAQLLPSITPDNAQAWFRHCGINYIPQVKML